MGESDQAGQGRKACCGIDRSKERDLEVACAAAPHGRRARHPKKSRAVLCERARVKYRFINDHREHFAVLRLCRMLQVTRAGFYAWLHKPMSDHAIEDLRLLALIRASYIAS